MRHVFHHAAGWSLAAAPSPEGVVVQSCQIGIPGLERLELQQHASNGLIQGYTVWTVRPLPRAWITPAECPAGVSLAEVETLNELQGWYPVKLWDEMAQPLARLHYQQLLDRLVVPEALPADSDQPEPIRKRF